MTVTADELIWHVHEHTIPAALALLPGRMDSPAARAMLLSIGLQESKFQHRVQVPGGPAHGFWQFEKGGGVKGVLEHPITVPIITPILDLLCYHAVTSACYEAIVHNDVLACVFARLLLWTDPRALPSEREPAKGWAIYVAQWRPGAVTRGTPADVARLKQIWNAHFAEGWRLVKET